MLKTAIACDVTFDALEFRRVLLRGVGDGRASAATRTAARSASSAATAAKAMAGFARAAADPTAPDVVAAYTGLCPAAAELFAALYLAAVRPAAAVAALDCLLAIVRYASGGDGRPRDAVDRAQCLVKDIVKGRAAALFDALAAGGIVAARALALLSEVAHSRPLLAKEAVNRFDFGARSVSVALCARPATSTPFTRLIVSLLTSGDHDVVWALTTRSRDALLAPLVAAHERGEAGPDAGAVDELLRALSARVLATPARSVARAAFEAPMLETVAALAAAGRDAAAELFVAVVSAPAAVVPAAHVSRVLAGVSIAAGGAALAVVLDGVRACPRAARMLLQTGPFVFAEPALSSPWLAAAAVVCRCAGELRTPTPVFARAKFLEKCWAHESPLVRHFGMLVAAALCKLVACHPDAHVVARDYLPSPAVMDSALRKAAGADTVALRVYGEYRSLFRKEFEESRTDAIRIAMDAGYGKKPSGLAHIVRACLTHRPDDALSTLFHRHVFLALLQEVVDSVAASSSKEGCEASAAWLLVRDILLATRLFPQGTQHETGVWISVVTGAGPSAALADFEAFVAAAWSKPYALFDDLSELSEARQPENACGEPLQCRPFTSLLTAAALRRIDKLGGKVVGTSSGFKDGSLGRLLANALEGVCLVLGSQSLADSILERINGTQECKTTLQGLLPVVARRLESGDEVDALLDLVDCLSTDNASAVAGIIKRCFQGACFKQWLSAERQAPFLALLLKITCYCGSAAAPLSVYALNSLRGGDAVEGAVVYAGALLRAPSSFPVGRAALETLCSVWDDDHDRVPEGLAEFGRLAISQSFADESSGINRLGARHVHHVLESVLKSSGDSGGNLCLLELLSQLLTTGDAEARAAAHVVIEEAFKTGKVRINFASLTFQDARSIRVLAVQLPCLRQILTDFVTSAAWKSAPTAMAILPSVEACVLNGELAAGTTSLERQLASAIIPVLLSSSSLTCMVPIADKAAFSVCLERVFTRLLCVEMCPNASAHVTEFLAMQAEHWRRKPSSAAEESVASLVLRTLFRLASTNAMLRRLHSSLVGVLVSFPNEALNTASLNGADLLGCMLECLKVNKILSSLDMRLLEELEKCVSSSMETCAKRCRGPRRESDSEDDQVVLLRVIVSSFQLDLMMGKVAGGILCDLAETKPVGASMEWLARAVSICVNRLARLGVEERVAQSLAKLEGVFSEAGVYNGFCSASDMSVLQAMEAIANALKSNGSRQTFLLPDNRDLLFQVKSADVVALLSVRSIGITAETLLNKGFRDGNSGACDPCFALTVLRRAACEAAARPTVAVLDLELVARSGLIGIAIAGLASGDETLRVLSYAALGALTKAVGPESGVSRDAASALYRDRRQLAFMLNLLRTSIRSPVERVLPLFATFFRLALPVVLRPTDGAYREVTRFLLRTPTHNVQDADGLACLFREESESCRLLALDVMRYGVCTGDDHHVARRRHLYDTLIVFGVQLPGAVLTVLTTIAGKCQGQVAADLIRGHGLLPWIMGDAFGANPLLTERLKLLTELATVLPRGVLCRRYSPCFARALEELALHAAAEQADVACAARAIARLTPSLRDLFDLPHRHRVYCLQSAVYSKFNVECSGDDEKLVVRALMSCCPRIAGSCDDAEFPATSEQEDATLAFASASLLKHAELKSSRAILSALACLLLHWRHDVVDIWVIFAILTVLPVPQWTEDLHLLAKRIPGTIPKDLKSVDARFRKQQIHRSSIARISQLLLESAELADSPPRCEERRRKRRKM